MDDAALQRCLDEAVGAAKEGGALLLEGLVRRDKVVRDKTNPCDLVTKYDEQIEKLIVARLLHAFPDITAVLAEESASKAGLTNDPTWIIDPIDGTTNFVHGQEECCILIGLAECKKAVLGVCYIPVLNALYTAVRGRGAFCNGGRLETSACCDLRQAIVSIHFPAYSRAPRILDRLQGLQRDLLQHPVQALRSPGSAGVDMVRIAAGQLDAYAEVGVSAWDICAGAVIVEEAGGVALDTLGGPLDLMSRRCLVASTPALAGELARFCARHQYSSVDAEDYVPPPPGSSLQQKDRG